MSALFFKRFLQRPFQVASIIPSSKALVKKVARKMDFTGPRIIAEYGPGEGVHSREIARRMSADSQLLLFELDAAFSRDLQRQFADDPRVHVVNGDAARLPEELKRRGIPRASLRFGGAIMIRREIGFLLQTGNAQQIAHGAFLSRVNDFGRAEPSQFGQESGISLQLSGKEIAGG